MEKAAGLSDAYTRMEQVFTEHGMRRLAQAVAGSMGRVRINGPAPLMVEREAVWSFVQPKSARKSISGAVESYYGAHLAFHSYVAQCQGEFRAPAAHRHSFVRGMTDIISICDSGHVRMSHDGEVEPDFVEGCTTATAERICARLALRRNIQTTG